VLAAEGDQAGDAGCVAALDVGAQELPALREAKRVDGRRGGKDGVGGQRGADVGEMEREVPEEGVVAVVGGVVVQADVVDQRARVDFGGEVADGAEAVGFVAGRC
jgi:hypothetical protein